VKIQPVKIRLNSAYNMSAACARIKAIPAQDPDHEYECVIRQYKGFKTGPQNRTIHKWAHEAAATDINEFAGHDYEWWKRRWKIEFYLPILEAEGDEEFNEMIERWRRIYREALPQDKPFVMRQLADSDALSFANIEQDHLSRLMERVQRDCAQKGILLTVPE